MESLGCSQVLGSLGAEGLFRSDIYSGTILYRMSSKHSLLERYLSNNEKLVILA